ncbi:MAG: phosphotransferase [Verrucomicrobiota bacterium]
MNPRDSLRPESGPFARVLEHVAQDWELDADSPRLLRDGHNHVYEARTPGGEPLIVKVTDGALREAVDLESELFWLAGLAERGCAVPTPVPARDGRSFASYQDGERTFHAALFQRLEGNTLDRPDPAIWDNPVFQREFGRLLGQLHRATDEIDFPPRLVRKQWYQDVEMMVPPTMPPVYDAGVISQMHAHQQKMRALADQATPPAYGLSHCDLIGPNVLRDGDRLWMLDFEMGCQHWRVIELAVLVLFFHVLLVWKLPDSSPETVHTLLQNLLAGYRQEHALDAAQLEMLPDTIGLRESFVYMVARPTPEKWDAAIENRNCTWRETVTDIEERWRNGRPSYDLDLHGL